MTEIPKLTDEDVKSLDLVAENVQRLKEIFPEIFAEDKIDFDRLQELLGHHVNEREDHYSFTWHGKRAAGRLAQTPSTGTLRPAKDESVDWDTTQNIFIEGDNLEVLKLLQKTYHRKVKMIYIDPPYNTGNDFVYKDDYTDSVRHYLEMTGQLDGEGKRLSPNSNSSGRYHTDWLNMMYPRLKLARNLLRDDGVIFISIDDNEQANLKKMCDDVFGEENFISSAVWQKRTSPDMRTAYSDAHEYVIIFSRNRDAALRAFSLLEITKDQKERYKNPDNDPKGPWVSSDFTAQGFRPNQMYKIVTPGGKVYEPPLGRCWKNVEDVFNKQVEDGRFWFGSDGNGVPRRKNYLNETEGKVPWSWWPNDELGHYQEAKKEVNALFEAAEVFSTPKPIRLVRRALQIATQSEDIILDFFAGSGTTGHAVMQQNAEDGGRRRYVLVQLPEATPEKSEASKAGYATIAEITKERLRRAARKIKEENPTFTGDLGFRVFKLDTSNLNRWDAGFDTLDLDLLNALDHVKKDRSPDDLLYELLLKYGLDLAAPVETRLIAGKTVHSVGLGALIVCLDDDVSLATVEGIAALKEELQPDAMRVVFRDSGFRDDVVKTNALQILKRHGIQDVKSL